MWFKYFVITYAFFGVIFIVWFYAKAISLIIKGRKEVKRAYRKSVNLLTLHCCFCDIKIASGDSIQMNELNRCNYCESDVQALPPKNGETVCQIGVWSSTLA